MDTSLLIFLKTPRIGALSIEDSQSILTVQQNPDFIHDVFQTLNCCTKRPLISLPNV